jgi:Ca2+-transporting ATPase
MGYILAIHVPIAGLALLPVLFGWPLILTPMLIALLELIIDPACSIVLEAEREEEDVMLRPPRRPASTLLSWPLIFWSLTQGACAFLVVAAIFAGGIASGMSEDAVRTLSFLAAFGRPNPLLWWGLGLAAVVLTLIVVTPPVREFFGLVQPGAAQLALIAMSAAALLAMLELVKRAWRRRLET